MHNTAQSYWITVMYKNSGYHRCLSEIVMVVIRIHVHKTEQFKVTLFEKVFSRLVKTSTSFVEAV